MGGATGLGARRWCSAGQTYSGGDNPGSWDLRFEDVHGISSDCCAKGGVPIANVLARDAELLEARRRHVLGHLAGVPLIAHAPSFDAEDGV